MIRKNKSKAPVLILPEVFSELEEVLQGKKPQSIIDGDNDVNIVYAYYQKQQMVNKMSKEVELFNLLFYVNDRYVLDELVKVLNLKQIKDLNSKGYIIGKWICHTNYGAKKLNENMNLVNNVNDRVYDNAKDYFSKSNKIGASLVDIREVELAPTGKGHHSGQT